MIFRRPLPPTPRVGFPAQLASPSDSDQSPEKPCPVAVSPLSPTPSAALRRPSRPKIFKKPSISTRGLSLPRFRPRCKAVGAKLDLDSGSSPDSSPRASACPDLGRSLPTPSPRLTLIPSLGKRPRSPPVQKSDWVAKRLRRLPAYFYRRLPDWFYLPEVDAAVAHCAPANTDVARAYPGVAREVAAGRGSSLNTGEEAGVDAGEDGDAEDEEDDWGY